MTIIEFNANVYSKTTYEVPVLFGDSKYQDRSLYSYSIFEDNMVKEVRFKERLVIKYHFDDSNVLKQIDQYDHKNNLFSVQFNLLEKTEDLILLEQKAWGKGTNMHCTFKRDNAEQQWSLTFSRVDSFLGNKMCGIFNGVKDSMFQEERYFQRETYSGAYKFKFMLQNEYVMRDNRIDEIARRILSNGWG